MRHLIYCLGFFVFCLSCTKKEEKGPSPSFLKNEFVGVWKATDDCEFERIKGKEIVIRKNPQDKRIFETKWPGYDFFPLNQPGQIVVTGPEGNKSSAHTRTESYEDGRRVIVAGMWSWSQKEKKNFYASILTYRLGEDGTLVYEKRNLSSFVTGREIEFTDSKKAQPNNFRCVFKKK